MCLPHSNIRNTMLAWDQEWIQRNHYSQLESLEYKMQISIDGISSYKKYTSRDRNFSENVINYRYLFFFNMEYK